MDRFMNSGVGWIVGIGGWILGFGWLLISFAVAYLFVPKDDRKRQLGIVILAILIQTSLGLFTLAGFITAYSNLPAIEVNPYLIGYGCMCILSMTCALVSSLIAQKKEF